MYWRARVSAILDERDEGTYEFPVKIPDTDGVDELVGGNADANGHVLKQGSARALGERHDVTYHHGETASTNMVRENLNCISDKHVL